MTVESISPHHITFSSIVTGLIVGTGFSLASTTNPRDAYGLSEQVGTGGASPPLTPCCERPEACYAATHALRLSARAYAPRCPMLLFFVPSNPLPPPVRPQAGTLEPPRVCKTAEAGGRLLTAAERAPNLNMCVCTAVTGALAGGSYCHACSSICFSLGAFLV